jgi:predicted RecA/RadA family phage recombinase
MPIALSGTNGVTFPGGTGTLNFYETGTFTPAIEGTTIAGVGTYTAQTGNYVRIGNLVFISVALNWTAHTGTGNINGITGLPFSSASDGGNQILSISTGALAMTASNFPFALIFPNDTMINIRQSPTGGGAAAVIAMDAVASVNVTGVYRIA